jgi:hypothetical protein
VPGKVANRELFAVRDSPGIFIMRGCGLHWVLGFDNAWASGGGGECGRKKQNKKTKSFSSFVARPGEEEEEECYLKQHYFVFLSFFCVGI